MISVIAEVCMAPDEGRLFSGRPSSGAMHTSAMTDIMV